MMILHGEAKVWKSHVVWIKALLDHKLKLIRARKLHPKYIKYVSHSILMVSFRSGREVLYYVSWHLSMRLILSSASSLPYKKCSKHYLADRALPSSSEGDWKDNKWSTTNLHFFQTVADGSISPFCMGLFFSCTFCHSHHGFHLSMVCCVLWVICVN